MHKDLLAAGIPHVWVGLHNETANSQEMQHEIDSGTVFPLFQELSKRSLRVSLAHKTRHDIFVFDAAGKLRTHIVGVEDAYTDTGYAALKPKIMAALN